MGPSNVCVSKSSLTPLAFLRRSAIVYREKLAVVYGDGRYTYGELAERVQQLASALKKAGLQPGDRVAFLSPNTPAMLEAHFAVPLAGGVLVAINIRLSSSEIAYILAHCGSRFLFVDEQLAHLVGPVRSDLHPLQHVVRIADGIANEPFDGSEYEAFLAGGGLDDLSWEPEDEDATIAINYTSGTTGRPKGVMYTHRGAYLNAVGEVLETNLVPQSVYLWTLPMFHCNGWCFTWGVTAVGARHVCLRSVDPAVVWSLIESEHVTHFNGAPVVMASLLNHPGRPERLDRRLTVSVAGAPPSPTLIEHMEKLNARVIHVYGLTETYGPHTVCTHQAGWSSLDPFQRAKLLARQGVCYVMTDPVRVVDEQMNDVPADGSTMGEVIMRGNNLMKGYFNDPEATEKAFRGGWFHSGDLGVMHSDGYIELRDRGKDVIITGGENVSSIEVEQTLYRHEAVREVAVIGVPHDKWGETPKAFVALKDGHRVTAEELIAFCRDRLAHFKCPTAVEFTEIPKTATGKIQKYVLREKEWAGRDCKIQGA